MTSCSPGLVLLVISRLVVYPTIDVDHVVRNKKNEKSAGLAELRREQEKLLYLCDSIKLSVTREEARVSIQLLFFLDNYADAVLKMRILVR